jgi:hypothetical protein
MALPHGQGGPPHGQGGPMSSIEHQTMDVITMVFDESDVT